MDKVRLQWKIFAFLLGFCALLLAVLWLFQTVLLNEMYKSIRKQELDKAVSVIESEIGKCYSTSVTDLENLEAFLDNIEIEKDLIIRATHDFEPPRRAQVGGVMLDTITVEKEFEFADGEMVSLTFHAVIIPVNATVTTLRYQLYWISGIMFVSAIFLAAIIVKTTSKPIEDVIRELGRVEALRRELLANVSHDLRTPLALIYSHAEMMGDFPNEITPEQIRVIMDESKRLATLVNDVLDISKIESNMDVLNISNFNLTQIVADTAERMGEMLKSNGFEIDFIHDEDVFVNADKTKIDRVFYNLLINAVNHSGEADENKKIVVEQTTIEDRIRISVIDSGEGIAEDELPYIWDRYYKSGKNHKRAVTGTGLGLSIVKKIMDMHSGDYGVSTKSGEGSSFWFELRR